MALFVPKDRRSLFRQFLSGMYDAVVITDPNGHILDVNPRATEYFGHELEEILDAPVSTIIPGLKEDVVPRIRKGLDGNRRVMINAAGLAKDGRKFACEVAVSLIDLMSPGDLVFTVRSIEKRREALAVYRSKENAFNISAAALFVCTAEGNFAETNAAFREMFGIESEVAAKGLKFQDLMGDDPLPAKFAAALAGEKSTVGLVAEGDGDDQEELEITLGPNEVGGKVVGVVGSVIQV